MKVLLIGPNPPPHGGISVHVSGIQRQLMAAGVTCRILDTSVVRPGLKFCLTVLRYAFQGWTLHLHTNGHNVRSWLVALVGGLAGRFSAGCILTLHSGIVPTYLDTAPSWRRRLAAFTCSLYEQVICVNEEIRDAVLALGLGSQLRIEVLPAFLGCGIVSPQADAGTLIGTPRVSRWALAEWIGRHRPLFSTALFFRPEYGFDVLVAALALLHRRYPAFGCVVMGSGEQRAEAETRIREAGIEGNVLLLGDVDHEVCLELISTSDVFLRATLEDGDSISVREALALGVPVVASSVGTRPAGAILFRAGDVNELATQVETALASTRGDKSQVAGDMDRLMEIYRDVDGSEVAYA